MDLVVWHEVQRNVFEKLGAVNVEKGLRRKNRCGHDYLGNNKGAKG
jgi:hypothetical protein